MVEFAENIATQPSLAGAGAWAELGNILAYCLRLTLRSIYSLPTNKIMLITQMKHDQSCYFHQLLNPKKKRCEFIGCYVLSSAFAKSRLIEITQKSCFVQFVMPTSNI